MIRKSHLLGNRRSRPPQKRKGAIIVLFAIILTVLIGFLGLVIDGGLLLARHRQSQNMSDTAALAYAMARLRGKTPETATTSGTTFVQTHNGEAAATVVLNEPPTSGPYAGMEGHVEAIITLPTNTFFIHILGVSQSQTVQARAVARWNELRTAGEGALVLDPRCSNSPGMSIGGNGRLVVRGGVFNNNQGGGVTETGDPINNGCNQVAADGGVANSVNGVSTTSYTVVGGVNDPALFKNIDTGTNDPNILHTGSLPLPDPLASLATPSVANGVIDTPSLYGGGRWDVGVTNNSASGVGPPGSPGPEQDPDTGVVTMKPGIYKQISISGGNVVFQPGIYVIAAGGQNALTITGGTVTGSGIMFYNTGANYDPATGSPDANDPWDPTGSNPPPSPNQSGTTFGTVSVNSIINFRPIDTTQYTYTDPAGNGLPGIGVFNGMLFYQRRGNAQTVAISGNAADGYIGGTVYAKWSRFQISGQGVYDAQFIVGTMDITGNADVTFNFAGQGVGKAATVFLVE